MAITDKIHLRHHRRIVSQLEVRIPRRAFAGSTLDVIFEGQGLADLDDALQEQILDFAEDFLDCDCEGAPFCGHPEEKFVRYLLELRAEGFDPGEIVEIMGADYGLTAYSADILTFLDDAARRLEAIEALADVEDAPAQARAARQARSAIEG